MGRNLRSPRLITRIPPTSDLRRRSQKVQRSIIASRVPGTGLDWLYTVDGLAGIQADLGCKCVWFITPSLYRNALVGKIKDAIRKNMERETGYKFIIPHSDEMDPKEVLKQMAESKPGQIHINDSIPAEEFRGLAVTDYLIMNAESGEPQSFSNCQ